MLWLILAFPTIILSQLYEVGDTFALEHQEMEFEICANGDGAQTLRLLDYNYLYNGGEHFVIWLDIFAAD